MEGDFIDPRAVDLIGKTDAHPDNHYGTTGMRDRLRDFYRKFYEVSSRDPEYTDKRVWINDMSLVYGGKFNVHGDWLGARGHIGHQKGIEADCGSDLVFPGLVRDPTFERVARSCGLYVHDEVDGGENSHYHLVFDDKVNPFPYVPPLSP